MTKFILSKSKVLTQYNQVKELADLVSYSSKTNPNITKILEKETNCLFSLHLKNELKNVKDKTRVLFLAQAWNKKQISDLLKQGINKFVVDNEKDLDTLLNCLDKEKITLLLRLKLKENTLRTERYFVFGMNAETIKKRIQELKNKNLELGIHFHRKTQNMSEWNYTYEIKNLLSEVLPLIKIVNMGGGLPAEYANTNKKVIKTVYKKIKEFKRLLNNKGIKLMIEPGRYISAPAVKLETKIISVYNHNIIVNASVYNTDMDALIVPIKLLVEGEGKGEAYVIKGITPCSMDLFRYRVYLKNPKIGDKLTFLNAGAYNFSTEFCELDKIETEIID